MLVQIVKDGNLCALQDQTKLFKLFKICKVAV